MRAGAEPTEAGHRSSQLLGVTLGIFHPSPDPARVTVSSAGELSGLSALVPGSVPGTQGGSGHRQEGENMEGKAQKQDTVLPTIVFLCLRRTLDIQEEIL